ncbi:protein of unknown function [Rhodovastum atsumiense]|nr:protein of unknown function [Rhodovastum atsumiense]
MVWPSSFRIECPVGATAPEGLRHPGHAAEARSDVTSWPMFARPGRTNVFRRVHADRESR